MGQISENVKWNIITGHLVAEVKVVHTTLTHNPEISEKKCIMLSIFAQNIFAQFYELLFLLGDGQIDGDVIPAFHQPSNCSRPLKLAKWVTLAPISHMDIRTTAFPDVWVVFVVTKPGNWRQTMICLNPNQVFLVRIWTLKLQTFGSCGSKAFRFGSGSSEGTTYYSLCLSDWKEVTVSGISENRVTPVLHTTHAGPCVIDADAW